MLATPAFAASQAAGWTRTRATHYTSASFPTLTALAAPPTGDGVIARPNTAPHWVPNYVALMFFGTGADDATGTARLVGWRQVGSLLLPQVLYEADFTLSAFVGVAGYDVLATDRIADTIADPAAGKGTAGVDCVALSPADNTPAHVLVDCKGCPYLRLDLKRGTATGLNGLAAAV